MDQARIPFPRNRLEGWIDARVERAIRRGSLRPIQTRETLVEQAGATFVVRVAENLARKAKAASGPDAVRNPFLPYDLDLYVCDVSETHVALLNKFNVLDRHLLIVTRAFEHQETALTQADFDALAACLEEVDGLGFYNSGPAAGASQPHKHLQLTPLPLSEAVPGIPSRPLISRHALPVRSACVRFGPGPPISTGRSGSQMHHAYLELLNRLSIRTQEADAEPPRLTPAYNLLITRKAMWMTPRRKEHARGISINALGFAGSLFVKDQAGLETVRSVGPLELLREVAG